MKRGIRKPEPDRTQKFFRIKEVAERWSMSEATIRRMIDRGELVATRFGTSVRISIEELRRHEK